MSSEKNSALKCCPYCLVLLLAPERPAHMRACDRIFYFKVRMRETVKGSVNGVEYEYREGEIAHLEHDMYRQLQGRCERIMEVE
jgi:hypothetical protein